MTELERPDLECLERVEEVSGQTFPVALVVLLMYAWLPITITMMLVHYWRFVTPGLLLGAGVIDALTIWIMLRVLLACDRHSTNLRGIELRGPIRRVFVPWADVKNAYRKRADGLTGSQAVVLQTDVRTVRIHPHGMSGSPVRSAIVIASIWQHLRRLGKHGGIELPPAALSLWEPVPAEVPDEVDWHASKSARMEPTMTSAVLGVFVVLIAYGFITSSHSAPSMALYGFVMLALFAGFGTMVRRSLGVATDARADMGGIEVDSALWKGYISWREVTQAWYEADGLALRFGTERRTIRIKAFTRQNLDGETDQLILACIRHIRASCPQIALPLPYVGPVVKTAAYAGLKMKSGKAYLLSLEPETRKRIQSIDTIIGFSGVAAFLGMCVLGMLDVPGRLAQLVFGGSSAIGFSTSSGGLVTVALILPAACGVPLLLLPFAARRAGPYRKEWEEYVKRDLPLALARRVVSVMAVIGAAGAIVAFFCYAKVTPAGIEVARPFHFRADHYSWQQVRLIEDVTESYTKNTQTRYVVSFDDGTLWSASTGHEMDSGTRLRAIIKTISQYSGKPITYKQP